MVNRTSAQEAIEKFDTPAAAAKYARALGGTATHHRELKCILRGLAGVHGGSRVLDLPCGTGRLLPELVARGYRVVSADSSPHMVALAQEYADQCGLALPDEDFVVTSALETCFEGEAFDAVVCNRLFHHFRESDVRQAALRELKRICKGPIVISFFCNLAFDAAVFHLRQALRSKPETDRIPISRSAMARDIHAAGLNVRHWMATRPGISKQWYVVVARD